MFRFTIRELVLVTVIAGPPTLACGQDIGAAAAQREEQLDAQVQEYVRMIQPLMWRELEFVRQTCELTPDVRPKIKAAGEAALKQAARDMISAHPTRRTPVAASQMIRGEIAKVLGATLPTEQLATYTAESEQRMKANKQAAIVSAVATIDGALFLTKEQRDKVASALEANWRDEWDQWLQMWQYAGRYYPQVPDTYVVPHLNEEQKTVWRGLQKVNFNNWGGRIERQPADDEWWAGKHATGQPKP